MNRELRRIEICSVLFVLGVLSAFARQEQPLTYGSKSRANQADAPTEVWFTARAGEISSEYQKTTPETLKNDKLVIKNAYPKIRAFYSDKEFGRSDSQLLNILGHTWSDFRKENPNIKLTSEKFATLAEAYGGLRITSDPPGAEIQIDEKPWVDPTNTEGAAHVGERVIRLSKEGYEPASGTALVKQGEWTPFFRKLKKK